MLSGKTALITGGSRGIGAAIARKFASMGANIAIVYVGNREAAQSVCGQCEGYGVKAAAYQCNVADFEEVKAAVAAVRKDFGGIQILVNSAGITKAMKESDIRKYAMLMKELELTGLEITENNQVVRLERNAPVPVTPAAVPAEPMAVPEKQESGLSITSPIVGLFYAAPAENAEPYVSLGDRVKKGQTLCIVEAMKLMNEITAEFDGIIEKICAANGQMVEYGTELFRIRREL